MNFIARIENWKDINTTYKYVQWKLCIHYLLAKLGYLLVSNNDALNQHVYNTIFRYDRDKKENSKDVYYQVFLS